MTIRIFGRKRNKGREPEDVEGTVRRADIDLPDPMRGDDPLPPDIGKLGPITDDEEDE